VTSLGKGFKVYHVRYRALPERVPQDAQLSSLANEIWKTIPAKSEYFLI